MEATPSFSESLGLGKDDTVDDVDVDDNVVYGASDEAVVLFQSSSRASLVRNDIGTPSSPSSRALVLHVQSSPIQEHVQIPEIIDSPKP